VTTAPDHSASPMRVLQVLEALAGMEQPASLEAVAETLNLTVSKAYRALRALQDQGFVDHVGRQGYRLGSRSVALASLIGPRPALVRTAQPVINRLAAVASETATLHLRSGAHRVLVLGAESRTHSVERIGSHVQLASAETTPLRRAVTIGERAPLMSGCSGLAILAFLPQATIEQLINNRQRGLPRPSESTLARIRENGYAMSFSENHVGLNGIGAPVLDPENSYALASVVVSGAEASLPEEVLRELSGPLKTACDQLSARLAAVLGPHASQRLAGQDVTVQALLEL
jgi:IclR family acetate operon transcriptional repressor